MNNNKLLLDGIKHYLDNNKPSAVGGGIKLFNFELVNETPISYEYVIHGATMNDIKGVFMLNGIFGPNTEPYTVPYVYGDLGEMGAAIACFLPNLYLDAYMIDGEYLDGVKVHTMKAD